MRFMLVEVFLEIAYQRNKRRRFKFSQAASVCQRKVGHNSPSNNLSEQIICGSCSNMVTFLSASFRPYRQVTEKISSHRVV